MDKRQKKAAFSGIPAILRKNNLVGCAPFLLLLRSKSTELRERAFHSGRPIAARSDSLLTHGLRQCTSPGMRRRLFVIIPLSGEVPAIAFPRLCSVAPS